MLGQRRGLSIHVRYETFETALNTTSRLSFSEHLRAFYREELILLSGFRETAEALSSATVRIRTDSTLSVWQALARIVDWLKGQECILEQASMCLGCGWSSQGRCLLPGVYIPVTYYFYSWLVWSWVESGRSLTNDHHLASSSLSVSLKVDVMNIRRVCHPCEDAHMAVAPYTAPPPTVDTKLKCMFKPLAIDGPLKMWAPALISLLSSGVSATLLRSSIKSSTVVESP